MENSMNQVENPYNSINKKDIEATNNKHRNRMDQIRQARADHFNGRSKINRNNKEGIDRTFYG